MDHACFPIILDLALHRPWLLTADCLYEIRCPATYSRTLPNRITKYNYDYDYYDSELLWLVSLCSCV